MSPFVVLLYAVTVPLPTTECAFDVQSADGNRLGKLRCIAGVGRTH